MNSPEKLQTVLLADDDLEDRLLTSRALKACHFCKDLRFVENGEELMDYLYQRGKFQSGSSAPPPDLILLDLKMPRKDGREALMEIKAEPAFRQIPVVVLTTSSSERDITESYNFGANTYITKPSRFEVWVQTMSVLKQYWFEVATLPFKPNRA